MRQIIFILGFIFSSTALFSTPGDLDTTFNSTGYVVTNIGELTGTNDAVRAVAIDDSNNFVVAGTNGIDFALARYTSAGVIDTTFGESGTGIVTTDMQGTIDTAYAVAIDGTSYIVAVGTDQTNFALAWYTSAGVLDITRGTVGKTFTKIGASTTNTAYGVAIDSSHNVVVVGTNGTDFVVARYLGTTGQLDTAGFGSPNGYVTTSVGATDTAYAVTIQTDGKIVVAGRTTTSNNFIVARYLTNGLLDTVANGGSGFNQVGTPGYNSTNLGGTDIAYAVALQSDGKIVLAGSSGNNYGLARYTTAGILDTTTFGSPNGYVTTNISGTDIAYGIKIQTSNQYIVASGTSGNNFSAARYTTTGTMDTTFGGGIGSVMTNLGGTDIAYGSVITSGNNIVLSGTNGSNFALAQYTTNGVLNTAGFGSPNGYVLTDVGTGTIDADKSCAIQPDGKIVIVGSNAGSLALARYTITGVLDTTFGTDGIVSGTLGTTKASIGYGVTIQSNGYIVVVGAAATTGTTPNRFLVARYTPTGALDTSFNTVGYITTAISGATSIAYGMALQTDGKIVVCGLSGATPTPIFTVARYTSAGVLDTGTFGSGLGYVRTTISTRSIAFSVAITSSGNIVACGQSGTTLALPAFTVAEYTSAGVLNSGSFGTAGSPAGTVRTSIGTTSIGYGIAINSSGNIVVAGVTTTASNSNFAVAEYTSVGVLNSGSFGTGGTPAGTVTTEFGGTDIGYAVAIQSNGYYVVSGISAGNIAMARYTIAGVLDTGFGTGGKLTTVLPSGIESGTMGLFIQPNGRIVTCAGTSSLNGDFATLRYLGDTPPQGCVDVTYQSDGYLTYPAGSSAAYNPQVTGLQIQTDNSVYVVSKDLLTTAQSRLVKLSSTGSTAMAAVTIAQAGATDVIEDSQDNVLVVGTNSTPRGWIARYTTSTGALVADSTFGTSGIVVESTNSTSFKRVCQQGAAQIITMGQGATATTGVLIAYNELGVINSSGFGASGIYSLASSTFSDMLIDSSSRIYVACQVTGDGIRILRVLANGSGLDTSFGPSSHGYVDTGLVAASYGSPSISFDNSGNIIVAAVATSTGNMVFQKYLSTATSDTPAASGTITQATTNLTTPVILTQLQCDTNNRPVFTGYSSNSMIVGRLNLVSTTYSLDTTFAPYSACPGILKTAYNDEDPSDATTPKRVAAAVGIGANGAILFGGYEAITSTTAVSLVARVVGDTTPYGQVSRYPRQTVGGIDQTFGTNGNLSLASISAGGIARSLKVLPTGKMLVAIDTGTNTIIAQLNSDYTLNTTTFGSPSGTGGTITLSGMINSQNFMIDTVGDIYITCQNALTGLWNLAKITSNGSAITWMATTNLVLGKDIREQSSGRILCTGKNDAGGIVIGFDPNNGTLDGYFGGNLPSGNPGNIPVTNPGYYQSAYTSQVADISVINTTEDTFIFANRDATGHAIVTCLFQNGYQPDSDFAFGTPIAGVTSDDAIHLLVDNNGYIVVVAKTSTGFTAQRYTAIGASSGTGTAGPVTIALTNPSTATIQNIVSASDGSTLILGSNSNGNQIVVARLNPAFVLDTTFNTTGLLESGDLPMTQFYDIDVTSTINNNIVVCGASLTPVPYLTNIYNNVAVTEVPQSAPTLVTIGTLDLSLNPEITPGYINLHTQTGADFVYSRAMRIELQLSNGIYYIAADNGTNVEIISMNGHTDTQITPFGTSGVVTISGKTGITDLFLDGTGTLNVSGSSGGTAWIYRYNATDGTIISAFTPTAFLDVSTVVGQQTSTRILVAGKKGSSGTIIAYNSVTGALDATFGQIANLGYYYTGVNSTINDMKIDSNNNIYIIFNDASNNATTQQISANGGAVGNPVWTGDSVIANSTLATNNHLMLALDSSGAVSSVIVCTVDTTTPKIVLKQYNYATGATTTTLNLTNGTTGFTDPFVAALSIDTNNKLLFCGYDNVGGVHTTFLARVTASLSALDTTFNPSPAPVPGIQSYIIPIGGSTTRAWYDVVINTEGRIEVVGYVNVSGNDTPYLARFYGTPFASQQSDVLPVGSQGTLDLTFNPPYGNYDLNLLNHTYLDNTSANAMFTTPDDFAYIAFDNGTSASYLIRMQHAGDVLDALYNPAGANGMPQGFAVTAPQGVASILYDGASRILLTGTNG